MGNSIVTTVVDAISNVTQGIGSSIQNLFTSLFVGAEGGISNLAIWGLTFVGVGFVIGLARVLMRKLG